MTKVFYGSAIQGAKDRAERAHINKALIECIKHEGYTVAFEHTCGRTVEETAELLGKAVGPLPPVGIERTIYVRQKLIEAVEGGIAAAIFEVSTPALGTGIELAHAYLRPRMGLPEIPILLLYQEGYWPNNLSSMVRGISAEEAPALNLKQYKDLDEAKACIAQFLTGLNRE
ncbi:MAG: hypothetical protein ACYSWQ_27330 [Planctomycetota bacterium]|jgi:hypothetical protein